MHSKNNIGIVKDIVHYDVDSRSQIPDFIVMKKPQFWMYHIACIQDQKRAALKKEQTCKIAKLAKTAYVKNDQAVPSESKKQRTQYQLISAKTLQKCMHHDEPVFLAFVRPTNTVREQGMT